MSPVRCNPHGSARLPTCRPSPSCQVPSMDRSLSSGLSPCVSCEGPLDRKDPYHRPCPLEVVDQDGCLQALGMQAGRGLCLGHLEPPPPDHRDTWRPDGDTAPLTMVWTFRLYVYESYFHS